MQSKSKPKLKSSSKKSKTKTEALSLTTFRNTESKKNRKDSKLFRKYKRTNDHMEPGSFLIRSRKSSLRNCTLARKNSIKVSSK